MLPTHGIVLRLRCSHCGRRGATLGCRVERCKLSFHLACAKTAGATFYPSKFLLACPAHRAVFRREEEAERWAWRSGPLWTAPLTVSSCALSRTLNVKLDTFSDDACCRSFQVRNSRGYPGSRCTTHELIQYCS